MRNLISPIIFYYVNEGSNPCAVGNGGCPELCLLSSSGTQDHVCVNSSELNVGSGGTYCLGEHSIKN